MADEALLNLPTDAFVEILLRLPSRKRWRLRLVCRRWRDVIRDRTPAPSRPVPLAFVLNYNADHVETSASAYAIDDDLEQGRCCRELWRSGNAPPTRVYDSTLHRHVYTNRFDTALVGTCNGVLCLCDDTVRGGAVSLVNPATGETLAVPTPPGSGQRAWGLGMAGWHAAYGFAFDAATERYKVVHVPCYYDQTGGFSAVQVFTPAPGAAAWRDVPVPGGGSSCLLDAGIVSVDGVTYWVTKNTESVVSFDLREERVAFTKALPARGERGYAWHLAEVHGRLGVVSTAVDVRRNPEKIEVWVLGDGGRGGWSRRYSVHVDGVADRIARPHFAHGDHVLLTGNKDQVVCGHRLENAARRWRSGEVLSVRVTTEMLGVAVSGISGKIRGIFAYVENTEPFSAHNNSRASS